MKKVSIIIPARNEERRLPACLDSIAKLRYPRELVETVVVDNGSTDRTREVAERYGARVLVDAEKNVSGLRNLGAGVATGDLLAFVDADCEVAPDWLEAAAKYGDELGIVAWGAPPVPPEGGTWVQRTWFLVRSKKQGAQEVEWLESMNLFVRKGQFTAVRGFSEDLVTCEDVDLSYRLRRQGKILSDSSIRVVHNGEAATVREFVRKELWRGRSNWEGVRSHGLTLQELPSLAIPAYYGVLLPVSVLTAGFLGGAWWVAVAALVAAPSGAVLSKVRQKGPLKLCDMMQLAVLLQVYFLSRTWALAESFRSGKG